MYVVLHYQSHHPKIVHNKIIFLEFSSIFFKISVCRHILNPNTCRVILNLSAIHIINVFMFCTWRGTSMKMIIYFLKIKLKVANITPWSQNFSGDFKEEKKKNNTSSLANSPGRNSDISPLIISNASHVFGN